MELSEFNPEVQRQAKVFPIKAALLSDGMTTDDAVECMRRYRLAKALQQPSLAPAPESTPKRKGTGPLCAPVYQAGLGK